MTTTKLCLLDVIESVKNFRRVIVLNSNDVNIASSSIFFFDDGGDCFCFDETKENNVKRFFNEIFCCCFFDDDESMKDNFNRSDK